MTRTLFCFLLLSTPALAQTSDLASALRTLDTRIAPAGSEQSKEFARVLSDDLRLRRDTANQRESALWQTINTREEWEKYRDVRIKALKESLGSFPHTDLNLRVTKTLKGEGFEIDNLLYESRPGLVVTANLYKPQKANPPGSPGILIIHSHHNPKTQGELQDMGMTWARAGCYVLVPDQLGHGERRQHPFIDKASFQGDFKPGRQDYFFRYNVALQLHLIGESLIGWMAQDMMRGVDVLLKQPGIDAKKIILLGSVAGGGDPCAVTAVLDPRIAAAVPFNFGGPQPETKFPLANDAKITFNYAGGGSWESTRGLRRSTSDGFMPWVIVGSLAPRGLIYAHEFAWDQDRDPVWDRLKKIYSFYGSDRLSSAKGRGSVTGQPPESTHCNNIGAEHRKPIHAAFEKWFGMPIPREYQKRLSAEELACVTDKTQMKPLHMIASEIGRERVALARSWLDKLPPSKRANSLGVEWVKLLGKPEVNEHGIRYVDTVRVRNIEARKYVAYSKSDGQPHTVNVPILVLMPPFKGPGRVPAVVAISQEGKEGFLKHRSETIAALLGAGIAVCLPDLRGTGESRPSGDSRSRASVSTSLSSSELMLGRTMLGTRLFELRTVLSYVQGLFVEPGLVLDANRIALWGDSFAPENPPDRNLAVPLDAAKMPSQAEPMGGLLALFGALYNKDIRATYVRGGLVSYLSVLESPFIYLPHDVIIPGTLKAGDLGDVAAALAPRPLRLEGLVDALNRRASAKALADAYSPTSEAYRDAKVPSAFVVEENPSTAQQVSQWFVANLK